MGAYGEDAATPVLFPGQGCTPKSADHAPFLS